MNLDVRAASPRNKNKTPSKRWRAFFLTGKDGAFYSLRHQLIMVMVFCTDPLGGSTQTWE
jgi:hypothetical protein